MSVDRGEADLAFRPHRLPLMTRSRRGGEYAVATRHNAFVSLPFERRPDQSDLLGKGSVDDPVLHP
jgi:hypothetical protein